MENSKDSGKEFSSPTKKEFPSPTKTSPLIIRVSPHSKLKSINEDSSSIKLGETNLTKSSVRKLQFGKNDSNTIKNSVTNVEEANTSLINSNLNYCAKNLVKSNDTKPHDISKEKDTEETNTLTQSSNKTKHVKKDSKGFTKSPAIDAKVCPFKATRKRKLSQIQTCDAISPSSSSSNSPNPAQIKDESSNSLQAQISNKEITDLEKMREELQQQLRDHLFDSSDEEGERPQTQDKTPSITTLKFGRDPFEDSNAEKSCADTESDDYRSATLVILKHPFEDSNAEESSADAESADFQGTLEKCDGALLKEGLPAELDQPPLVMQSSNLLFNDELDNGHGEGGLESTREVGTSEPPAKKPKLPEVDEESCADAESDDSRSATLKILKHPFEDSNDEKSCAEAESEDFQSTREKCDGAFLKEKPPAKPDQPPLVMQSSNLLFNDELDNGHGGGGLESTREEGTAEPPAKKSKLPEVDEESCADAESDNFRSATLKIFKDISKDSNAKESCANAESADFQSTLEKCDGVSSKEGPTAEPDQPPLVMQSSNLLFNDELDNGHGGGGLETTQEEGTAEPPAKKPKLTEADEEGSVEKAVNDADEVDSDPAEKDDGASTSTVDPLNSEQNGVMEFDILDEFESDDNEPNESDSEDSDLSMDEIDAMLEKDYEVKNVNKEPEHEEKEKVILKVRGRDHFDVLPEGWIEVTHNSGMPIYLHKQSRVCSVSKPYFLGPGSTRKHEIPMSAIPCLHYLKEIEKENSAQDNPEDNGNTEPEKPPDPSETSDKVNDAPEKKKENAASIALLLNNNKENTNVVNSVIPSARLESVKEQKESGSLDYLAVREYCQKRFEFQTITVKRFKTWSGRRKHQKQLKRQQRPYLPDSTKLITCPLYASSDKTSTLGSNAKKEFIMNPSGKSPVCILHEYVQHTLRLQPKYVFKELESASTPYGAVVIIDDVEYGCGFGSSKKLAKSDAAKSALEILIPKMKMFAPEGQNEECQDVEFFDQVRVEDPRVCELSVKAGQPYPYQILLECLKRNYGMGDTEIEFSMNNLKHQKNEFSMKVGKHEVAVVCKNKRDGKHRASQAILQRLHPHIKSWGSLLRMYGKGSCKTLKEKKEEEQRITELQSQACVNKPNMSILNKLKEEMLKYRAKMVAKKPIGKLIPERMEFFSTSNSNLNNVEL